MWIQQQWLLKLVGNAESAERFPQLLQPLRARADKIALFVAPPQGIDLMLMNPTP